MGHKSKGSAVLALAAVSLIAVLLHPRSELPAFVADDAVLAAAERSGNLCGLPAKRTGGSVLVLHRGLWCAVVADTGANGIRHVECDGRVLCLFPVSNQP